jgi:alanine-glyoxylate transaminase/serine-glyoxylate transaminase/serine-pyruvate transaminase
MLPPGLSFNAISKKALAASGAAKLTCSYWDWQDMLNVNKQGVFPFTPATNLLYGLRESIRMLLEEGLDQVFSRHRRLAAATRAAVQGWELELNALNPNEYSNSLTAVLLPQGHDADAFRKGVLECFNVSLGNGLGRLNGKVFRIGHLGDFNEPMLLGTLGAIEMGLDLAEIPHRPQGVRAAMSNLVENNR